MIDFLRWIASLSFSVWMGSDSLWAFPTFLYLHTLGMSILAGSAAIISFALLGLWPTTAPLKPLERFYSLLWFGFGLQAVTGSALFMKDAVSYGRNPDFYVKLAFVFVGVALMVIMRKRVFHDPQLDSGPVPRHAKTLAWASLLCWFIVIVSGRLIAYIDPLF